MTRSERTLVVVSNRGPYRRESSDESARWVRSAGGLVAALDPVLRARGGLWVAAKQAKDFDTVPVEGPRLEYNLAHITLNAKEQRGFYEGVSNAMLWPILHGLAPTVRISHAPWAHYVTANRRFADAVIHDGKIDALIWVQDYQLMLVPKLVRAEFRDARIGWFCHVPWPSPETFGIFPWRTEVLEGLLGADLVGFHTDAYARNFVESVRQFTGAKVSKSTIEHNGKSTRVIVAPVGVPVDDLHALATDPEVEADVQRIRHSVGNRKLILGVDRLDYTKGITERLLAIRGLLETDRRARDRYAFVQVMVPSRTDVEAYRDLKAEIDRMVGDINGAFAETGRVPVHYLFRNLSQRALMAHYRAADAALVTPVRDGMNLVAQEYVTSRVEGDGVLILSEFAGASSYLTEALIVNPYDIRAVTHAISTAMHMSLAEQQTRMRSLRERVRELDVHKWASNFLTDLEGGRE